MDPTAERDEALAGGGWSSRRLWLVLLGGLVLFVIVFNLLEGLVTPDEPTAAELTGDAAEPAEPIRPRIEKLDDDVVQVSVEGGHRVTVHLDDAGQADALIACLEEGLATSSALTDGEAAQPPESNGLFARHRRAQQVMDEVNRVQNACMLSIAGAPFLPQPPAH